MSVILDSLQSTVVTRIASDAFFTPAAPAKPIPVVASIRGDVESAINTALAKLGLGILVDPPICPFGQVAGKIVLRDGTLDVWVFERPTMNKTGRSAAEAVAKIAHLFKQGSGQILSVAEARPVDMSQSILVWRVTLKIAPMELENPT